MAMTISELARSAGVGVETVRFYQRKGLIFDPKPAQLGGASGRRHYGPDEARRLILSVRPGVTDRATIEFRDEERLLAAASDPERAYVEQVMPIKQRYYLDYVARRSLAGDVGILIDTLRAVLGRADS